MSDDQQAVSGQDAAAIQSTPYICHGGQAGRPQGLAVGGGSKYNQPRRTYQAKHRPDLHRRQQFRLGHHAVEAGVIEVGTILLRTW